MCVCVRVCVRACVCVCVCVCAGIPCPVHDLFPQNLQLCEVASLTRQINNDVTCLPIHVHQRTCTCTCWLEAGYSKSHAAVLISAGAIEGEGCGLG